MQPVVPGLVSCVSFSCILLSFLLVGTGVPSALKSVFFLVKSYWERNETFSSFVMPLSGQGYLSRLLWK